MPTLYALGSESLRYASPVARLKHLFVAGIRLLATPTHFFFVSAMLVGFVVVVLTHPFAGDDEQTHFARSYAITRGDWMLEVRGFGVGSQLPSGLIDEMTRLRVLSGTESRSATWNRWNVDISDGPDEFVSYPMATLSPVGHIPGAIGIGIGRILGVSPFVLLLLARAANLMFYIAIVGSVIRVVPVLRWPLAWIGVFPSLLFVAANASPDPFAIAMVIAAIGLALVLRDRKIRNVPINPATWCAVFATAIALGNAKAPYFLAIGMFALPWLRARGHARLLIATAVVSTVAVGAIWALSFSDRYVIGAYVGSENASPIEKLIGGLPHPGGMDPTAQWERLRERPASFASAAWHMAARQGDRITAESLFDYSLWVPPWWLSLSGFLLLVGVRFSTPEHDRAHFSRVERLLVSTLLALLVGFILLSLFVYDTFANQQSLEINGMQGRYLAPLLPILMIAIPTIPRLRTPWRLLAVAQILLFGLVVFAVSAGNDPWYWVEILRKIPQ